MKTVMSRILSDYGMILVLLLLCAFFSLVTYREQSHPVLSPVASSRRRSSRKVAKHRAS